MTLDLVPVWQASMELGSVGGSLSRVAMHAFIKMAKEISEQGTFTGFDGLITNAELNKFFSEDRKKRQ